MHNDTVRMVAGERGIPSDDTVRIVFWFDNGALLYL